MKISLALSHRLLQVVISSIVTARSDITFEWLSRGLYVPFAID